MQIVDAIKNLIVAMGGCEKAEYIQTDQIAGAIQYMADNWEAIKAQITGDGGGEDAA